jgi:hypothetical protein
MRLACLLLVRSEISTVFMTWIVRSSFFFECECFLEFPNVVRRMIHASFTCLCYALARDLDMFTERTSMRQNKSEV